MDADMSTAEKVSQKLLGDNISELFKRLERSAEQIDICIGLLTDEIYLQQSTAAIEKIYGDVCSYSNSLTPTQKTRVCKRLCELAGETAVVNEMSVFGESETVAKEAVGKIAYVKNRRNDDAYLSFAKGVSGAKAEYSASFSDACEAVSDGRCEYCIIPIENSSDGKLYSFYQMLDRYDLKICRTTQISDEDGSEGIVFALMSDSIRASAKSGESLRFEFSVVGNNASFLGDILAAVSELGGEICSAATLPVRYDENSRRCYFAVELSSREAVVLALYLSLEYHGYTPLGLYAV